MRIINFSKRNFLEIIRDPLSIIFMLLLPLFLLFIFQQIDIPSDAYNIENFTPGITIFSFSFLTLFTSNIVSKDKTTSILSRLAISPMLSVEYIFGYIIALLPFVLMQNILFYALALIYGLNFSYGIFISIIISIPISIMYILLGILIGSLVSSNASSGISSIVVQLVAFTSGLYFETNMLGKGFKVICEILPFSHSLNIVKSFIINQYNNLISTIVILLLYTFIIGLLSVISFKKSLRK